MIPEIKKLENTEEANKLIATLFKKVISMNLYEPDFKACLFLYPDGIYLHRDNSSRFPWICSKHHTCAATEAWQLEDMIKWLDEAYQEFKKISEMRKRSIPLEDSTPEHIKDLEDDFKRIKDND